MRVIKTYEELKSPKEMIDSFMASRRVSKLDKELSSFKNKYIESIPKIVLSNVHDNHIPVGFYECRIKLRGDLIRKCFTDTDANLSDVMNNSELLVIFNSSVTNFLIKIILKSDKNIYNHFKVTGISNYPLLSSSRNEISLRISQNTNDPDDLIKVLKESFDKLPSTLGNLSILISQKIKEETGSRNKAKLRNDEINFLKSKHEEIEDCLLDFIDMDKNYVSKVEKNGSIQYTFSLKGIVFKGGLTDASWEEKNTVVSFQLTDELISLFNSLKTVKSRIEYISPNIKILTTFGGNNLTLTFDI